MQTSRLTLFGGTYLAPVLYLNVGSQPTFDCVSLSLWPSTHSFPQHLDDLTSHSTTTAISQFSSCRGCGRCGQGHCSDRESLLTSPNLTFLPLWKQANWVGIGTRPPPTTVHRRTLLRPSTLRRPARRLPPADLTTPTADHENPLKVPSGPAIPWPQAARCPPALPTGPIRLPRPPRPTLRVTNWAAGCSLQSRLGGRQTIPNPCTDEVNSQTCPCLPCTRLSAPPPRLSAPLQKQKVVATSSGRYLRHTRPFRVRLLQNPCPAFLPLLGRRCPRGQMYRRRYQSLKGTRRRHRAILDARGIWTCDKQRSGNHRSYLGATPIIINNSTYIPPNIRPRTILNTDNALRGNYRYRVYRRRLRGSPVPRWCPLRTLAGRRITPTRNPFGTTKEHWAGLSMPSRIWTPLTR